MKTYLASRFRSAWAGERGIALVIVLLVGAVLTAVSSAGAFTAINEFGASREDRAGAQSLSFAEAGIDRLMLSLRDGSVTWNDISGAGCTIGGITYPPIQVSGPIGTGGSYTASLTVYDADAADPADRFVPTACASASTDPRGGPHTFVIASVGTQPAARREIRQVIAIKPLDLPVGVYAYERIIGNGTVKMDSISMVSEGVMERRDDFGFIGTDPYYKINDFYGNGNTAGMYAAAHAIGQITYGPASKLTEHRTGYEPNCEANGGSGTAGQSLWDGSGTAVLESITGDCGWATKPPRSTFTEEDRKRVAPTPNLTEKDYLMLAEAARTKGLYCKESTTTVGKLSCIKAGVAQADTDPLIEDNSPLLTGLPNNFVAFFDYPTGGDPFATNKTVTWKASIQPCSTDPAVNRAVVLVVRNGSLSSEGGSYNVGAMLIPEGQFTNKGSFTLEGTIIAQRLDVRGTATFKLTACWVRNLPGPFLDVLPTTWTEVDR